jgi:hypothetical protein
MTWRTKWREKLRHHWHEVYYSSVSEKGTEFAMRCKDAVEDIDMGTTSLSWIRRARLRLHLSLCQACHNYFKSSQALRRAMKDLIRNNNRPRQIRRLNKELIQKFSKKNKDDQKP